MRRRRQRPNEADAVTAGEIRLEHASRSFSVQADRGRTLKELLIRPGRATAAGGPPPIPALRDVSLRVAPGETVGVVGRNGAGKSSTLRALAGIVPLDLGRVRCGGRVVSLLELGAGFGRDFSGRENIHLNGALHGFSRAQIEERMERIIAFSELGEFIEVPVRTYSSGMFVRLGFAIAAHLDADVMLIDEVLAVGDEAFQRKCLRRISELIAAGTTLVLVSHDPGAIERVCERVVVLDDGQVAFDGTTADGLLFYHRLLGSEDGGAEDHRRADRPIAVREIELRDADDRPAHLFRSGDPLRLVLGLEASGPVRAPRLALEVRDEQGTRVFRTAADVALSHGRARLVFEIERLALLGGDYDLAVVAVDGEPGDAFDRVLRFAVVREPGGEGVVDLRGRWSSAPAPERARAAP